MRMQTSTCCSEIACVDPEDRDLYEATKRALIKQDWADMNAYAEAKTEVIAGIKERARQSRP